MGDLRCITTHARTNKKGCVGALSRTNVEFTATFEYRRQNGEHGVLIFSVDVNTDNMEASEAKVLFRRVQVDARSSGTESSQPEHHWYSHFNDPESPELLAATPKIVPVHTSLQGST